MLTNLLTFAVFTFTRLSSCAEVTPFQYEFGADRGVLENGAIQNPFQRHWKQHSSHSSHSSRKTPKLGAYGNEQICVNYTVDSPYHTSHGVFYVIECLRGHWDMEPLGLFGHAESEAVCLEYCDERLECQGACYAYDTFDVNCFLLSKAPGPSNYFSLRGSYIYRIDPPTQPTPDEDLVACSTTCPSCEPPRWKRSAIIET